MSLVNAEHVQEMIRNSLVGINNTINAKFNELAGQMNQLRPPPVEQFQPVIIDPRVDSGNASLDLIKSVPEFDGNMASYPGWRAAALFAMNYYPENSEKFYVATGILRNKIVSVANTTLSGFNTVLNFKAIIERLDKSFADKRPLHVLENELSILRQDNSCLTDFYDKVDKQLNLIINKQIMSFHGQDDLVSALNERARENGLRVFISGLRRPLCDILFSARPKDLPSALVIAQELETNHRRNDFARAYAAGNLLRGSNQFKSHPTTNTNKPIPMDVDSSRFVRRSNQPQYQAPQQTQFNRPNRNNNPSQPNFQNHNQLAHLSQHLPNTAHFSRQNPEFSQQQYPSRDTGAIPKRPRDNSNSNRTPFLKQQRVNHMSDSNDMPDCEVSESESVVDYESENGEILDDISNNEINFLG